MSIHLNQDLTFSPDFEKPPYKRSRITGANYVWHFSLRIKNPGLLHHRPGFFIRYSVFSNIPFCKQKKIDLCCGKSS